MRIPPCTIPMQAYGPQPLERADKRPMAGVGVVASQASGTDPGGCAWVERSGSRRVLDEPGRGDEHRGVAQRGDSSPWIVSLCFEASV